MNFKAIPWMGTLALIISALPGAIFLIGFSKEDFFSIPFHSALSQMALAHRIQLPLAAERPLLSMDTAKDQISFSMDPIRPDGRQVDSRFLIRLGKSKQNKCISFHQGTVRLYLAFASTGILQFAEAPSSFWIDCSLSSEDLLLAALSVQTPEGEIVQTPSWVASLQEAPIQSSHDFPMGHPLQELATTRWWGQDLLMEKIKPGSSLHRLEIGSLGNAELIDCSLNEWLICKGNKWQKIRVLEETSEHLLARIKSVSSQSLEIEAWEKASYIRIKIPLASLSPLKIKGEELFSQLRVRSEKQVSCMLDKQCLVLRPGDWVLKSDSRWKTLKKKEEKEALLEGKLVGDLFILDRVDAKSPTKSIVGSYFAPGRTQSVLIEHMQKTHKGRKKVR